MKQREAIAVCHYKSEELMYLSNSLVNNNSAVSMRHTSGDKQIGRSFMLDAPIAGTARCVF